jgi:cysteine desulfurase / selenocysteine lyase
MWLSERLKNKFPINMYNLKSLRETEFPLSHEHIYLNHASISPLPQRTRRKMEWAVSRLAEQPSHHFAHEGRPAMEAFAAQAAAYVGAAEAYEVVPITTTSAALSAVALAVDWQAGDNVIFCEVEFPANAFPWLSLAREGVEARVAPTVKGGLTLTAVEPLVDKRTRLIAVSAIQFFTGHRADLAALGAFCRDRGIIFVVDAIQAIGHMKIDVQAMNIDVLATGGQKSLLAAPGTGFMYVREAVCATMRPRIIGPNATVDYLHWLDYNMTPLPGAQRFWSGTPNLVGIFGAMESLTLISELGVEAIDRHTTMLAAESMTLLAERGYELATFAGEHGPIVTFKTGVDGATTDSLVTYLAENKVAVVKHLDRAGVPYVRISFHCYNNIEEAHRFIALLDEWRQRQ